MNGIPRDQWHYWGSSERECARNILEHYYNPHLIKKLILLISVVVPIILNVKFDNLFLQAVTVAWYAGVVEFCLRRVILCKSF